MSHVNGFVPLIRSNRTSRNTKTILFHIKRFTGTICRRKLILYHLKRSTGTKYREKLILFHLKRFRGTKPEQIVVRISQHIRTTIRQSSPIHNRITDLSYTAMYTHPQTKRQRNGSTDMDTVPRKIGIRRVIPCRFPPRLSEKSSRD